MNRDTTAWRGANLPVKLVFGLNPGILLFPFIAFFTAKLFYDLSMVLMVISMVVLGFADYKGLPPRQLLRGIQSRLKRHKTIRFHSKYLRN